MIFTGNIRKNTKEAFTLAEILVTLGIIGIVAAMTIPNLMNNIQDSQFKTAAKKAFSVSAAAITQMRQDEGGSLASYYVTSGSFKPVFMTYSKVIKDCGASTCVPSSVLSDIYNTLSGVKAVTKYMDDGQFITSDGMFYGLDNFSGTGILGITVDVNGYDNKPNVFGKDVFMFQVVNDNLLPMGAPNTYFLASTYCNKNTNNNLQGIGCMVKVMQGIDY